MGVLIVGPSRGSTRTDEIFVDNDFKDDKKKKRRSRKSKQSLSASSSASELVDNASSQHGASNGYYQPPQEYKTSSHLAASSEPHQLPKEHNAGFNLMLSRDANEQTVNGNLQTQSCDDDNNDATLSDSVPKPAVIEEPVGPVLVAGPVDCQAEWKFFPPHLSAEAVTRALGNGKLLRALFHVHAHNRLEAYCKIDGVQTDVLISGMVAQNRAIEGDTVAIVVDPPSLWPRMKGSNEDLNDSASHCHDAFIHVQDCCRGKSKLDPEFEYAASNNMVFQNNCACYENGSSSEAMADNSYVNGALDNGYVNGWQQSISDATGSCCFDDAHDSMSSLEKLCALTSLYPSRRPTGRVVSVIERSIQRDSVVGFLSVKQWIHNRESKKMNSKKNRQPDLYNGYILLTPNNPKFTKMMVPVRNLPASIKKRLAAGDLTLESDLVAAKVIDWTEECYIPDACVIQNFGRGSDIEAQIAAILFENAIHASEFSSEVLSCLPHISWEVPQEELQRRRDLRNLCIFTIDPASATNLDDALSVEMLSNGAFRVGVHVADVSYFVLPDSALDIDAQIRSTSAYLFQRKLPMLPSVFSASFASLNPGVDRLAFSIFWDINSAGEILDRWIGRTIINSCTKLSYEHAQEIIDVAFDFQHSSQMVKQWPKLCGQFEWSDVVNSVKSLRAISKILRENRFNGSVLSGRKDSNILVEEFMLLANRTAAEVITSTYLSCALLGRHPEPIARKLRKFEGFCNEHGLKLEISSSAHLHQSLEHMREELKNDSVLFDILMSFAARPMQLASYLCSGDSKNARDHCHYALPVSLYTHFTSPLRRYRDIVVHRTLAAALEAEDIYLKSKRTLQNITKEENLSSCFTGMCFNKYKIESIEAQEALSTAASNHSVPCTKTLTDMAVHCNEKKLATRPVKDATDKLCMWALLKKKEILYSEARVLGIGPRFISVYIPKLATERRIYYDEVEGLTVEWLEATSVLVLSRSAYKRSNRKSSPGKYRTLEEVALIVNPAALKLEKDLSKNCEPQSLGDYEPAFFPLTVHPLSTIPVALHAVGGDDGPLDIVARFYIRSYTY